METLTFRLARPEDLAAVVALYDAVIDGPTNYTRWEHGRYPTPQVARAGIEEGTMYLAYIQDDPRLAATFILNQKQPEAFGDLAWPQDPEGQQALIIHTLAVHPDFSNRGIGRQCLAFARRQGEERGLLSLRLDVYTENWPGLHLYESFGFQYVGVVNLLRMQPPIKWFKVYELRL